MMALKKCSVATTLQCAEASTVCLAAASGRRVEVKYEDLVRPGNSGSSVNRSVCVISGYRGQGKSSLARELQLLKAFQGVFVVAGPELDEVGVMEAIYPQLLEETSCSLSQSEEWMEDACTLLVIDDFLPRWAEDAIEALQRWRKMSLVVLTTPEYAKKSQRTFDSAKICNCSAVKLHHLAALNMETVMSLTTDYVTIKEYPLVSKWIADNWWWANAVLRYKGLIELFCAAWESGLLEKVSTETKLLWTIIDSATARLDIDELSNNAMERWWTVLGGLCRRSLETGYPLNALEVEYEARRIFLHEKKGVSSSNLLNLFGESAACCGSRWLSLPEPLTNFLAGWNAFHQNLSGTALKCLVKHIEEEDPVVIYVAGHLARVSENGESPNEKQLTRLFRNLILHLDRTKDRFQYKLRILSESGLHPGLLKFLVADIDFPKLWEISDSTILVRPVEALLDHVYPTKVEVTVAKGHSAPQLTQVVRLLAERGIFMFLADMNHLTFGRSVCSDWLIQTIQKYGRESVLQDFMGCLTVRCLNNLGRHVTTQNLVCLRVRVTDAEAVKAACLTPATLPSLMWLEIDFDVPLNDLVNLSVSKVNTPLMDVTFRGLTDDDMFRLVTFLAAMRKHYSGIHIMESEVSPQGVRTLLKGFFTKSLKTSAHPDDISRYRAWCYPIVGQANWTQLSDGEARHLIGHDDRPQYSDNEVESLGFIAEKDEVQTLATFVQVLEDPVIFQYKCANYQVIKTIDRKVEIKVLEPY